MEKFIYNALYAVGVVSLLVCGFLYSKNDEYIFLGYGVATCLVFLGLGTVVKLLCDILDEIKNNHSKD